MRASRNKYQHHWWAFCTWPLKQYPINITMATLYPQRIVLQFFYGKKNICPKFGMNVTFWQFCIKKTNDFCILEETFYQFNLSSYFYLTCFCLMHLTFLNYKILEWNLVKYFISGNVCMWDVHLLSRVIVKFVTTGVILRLGEKYVFIHFYSFILPLSISNTLDLEKNKC
jgi:hypothetical protein